MSYTDIGFVSLGYFYFKNVAVYMTNVSHAGVPDLRPFSPDVALCGVLSTLKRSQRGSVLCPAEGVLGRYLVLQVNKSEDKAMLAVCDVAAYEGECITMTS